MGSDAILGGQLEKQIRDARLGYDATDQRFACLVGDTPMLSEVTEVCIDG